MASERPLTTDAGRPIDLRLLAPTDLPLFRDLQRMFAEAFEDAASYQSRPPSDAYVRRWLASPNAIALAAVADEGVVGGIAGYVLDKFEQERSEVYIYDLAVAESERRRPRPSPLRIVERGEPEPLGDVGRVLVCFRAIGVRGITRE